MTTINTLIVGAGVIGLTYGWQLAEAGHSVTVLVRPGKRLTAERDGFEIRYTDERRRPTARGVAAFRPAVVDRLDPAAAYELIVVAVRSNQVESVLPMIAAQPGQADVLFLTQAWHGDELIKEYLPPERYLFGFSRLVGGWRTDQQVDCLFFNGPGQVTMLGEISGRPTPRLQRLAAVFREAGLRPETSRDILSWLAAHYAEYLGAVGAILQAGSAKQFADSRPAVEAAILATREALAVCRARGVDLQAAPLNLRMYSLPLALIVPLGQKQYQAASIQQFFQENIDHGLDELRAQYAAVVADGRRLGVAMPQLESFEPYFRHAEPA